MSVGEGCPQWNRLLLTARKRMDIEQGNTKDFYYILSHLIFPTILELVIIFLQLEKRTDGPKMVRNFCKVIIPIGGEFEIQILCLAYSLTAI